MASEILENLNRKDFSSLEEKLNKISLEEKEKNLEKEEGIIKWHLPLQEFYKISCNFFKEKSGKAIHISYENNIKLIALTQQAAHGPFNSSAFPELGVLDFVGKDRRLAWQNLGSMSKFEAMESFIDNLDNLCPTFKPYIEAIKKDKEERLKQELEKKFKAAEDKENEMKLLDEQKRLEEQRYKEEQQRRQLQDALNQQTFHQFKEYAEKQFPSDPDQQAVLIKQLQNEHFHQYMAQLHSQFKFQLNEKSQNNNLNNDTTIGSELSTSECLDYSLIKTEVDNLSQKEPVLDENESEYLGISPAKMWTRPDIHFFKKDVSSGSGDGVISIGHGEVVTVRVPVHEGGSCIFWEFATDNYDIGFGLYFEWSQPTTNEVTVHISESDDEDELYDEDDEDLLNDEGDIESGSLPAHRNPITSNYKPPISILVPVYRRESQNEVYVGSHQYPGKGVYLLKFDNSFSIWRSKTLYYRVFYER